MITCVWI